MKGKVILELKFYSWVGAGYEDYRHEMGAFAAYVGRKSVLQGSSRHEFRKAYRESKSQPIRYIDKEE